MRLCACTPDACDVHPHCTHDQPTHSENLHQGSEFCCTDAQHKYHAGANDWGFKQFCALKDLQEDPEGFMPHGCPRIRVDVEASLDERFTGSSRLTTGFIGIKNEVRRGLQSLLL